MATLVLTTVGSLVGGPVGGAIGGLIGNRLDRAVLKPKGRQGPRLGDLTVQTSSYGNRIPKLFGRMRVAGTVIWATDLREDAHHGGGGKAGGSTTSYSYSVSFAVALSARAIRGVGRIWADGKLLRGQAGDWKSETGFRLYLGSEEQEIDPLIASAEGVDATPAHRGIAYAVFEGMELADYGNRVPSLTFEVEADAAPVEIGRIAEELGQGVLEGASGPAIGGFAATGDSVRGVMETLATVAPMSIADDGARLRLNDADVTVLAADDLGAGADGRGQARRDRAHAAADAVPDAVSITYHDPSRDYQVGLQRARSTGVPRREARIELPAAVDASTARALADDALARALRSRVKATVHLPWRALEVRAGARVMLEGATWRVAGWTLEHMALTLELEREGPARVLPRPVDPGRAANAADAAAGATMLVLAELPMLDDGLASTPRIVLAAAGTRPGWRRATASVSLDGGASWRTLGQTALPATMGSVLNRLEDGPAELIDTADFVDVRLPHDGMVLESADDRALAAGRNLALVGDELVQFGTAEQIAPDRYRLGRLLRGRRGTDDAMPRHAEKERFLLIDRATLLPIDVPLSAIGGEVQVLAIGPGDGSGAVRAARRVDGLAVRPPSPVHLRAERIGPATVRIRWVRRSRNGWAWMDGGDVPLGEDSERYRVALTVNGATRTAETTDTFHDVEAPPATMLSVSVAQVGTHASSPARTANWII